MPSRLRSAGPVRENNNSLDNPTATTAATTASRSTTSNVSNNPITPLLSIQFPTGFGPRTHSSPELTPSLNDNNSTNKSYSNINRGLPETDQIGHPNTSKRSDPANMSQSNQNNILSQAEETVRPNVSNISHMGNMAQLGNNTPQVDTAVSAGLTNEDIRRYVSASMQVVHASIMQEVQNMQLMLPRLIRESLHSERDNSRENPHHNPNINTFDSNEIPQRQQPSFPPNPSQSCQPPRSHHNAPHPLPANTPLDYSQHFLGFNNQPPYSGFGAITPNHLEKWGLKYDGSNKNITVEDFVFRVESLRADYNCSWDVVMKGFHHLLTGTANSWFWSFRMKYPVCDWFTFKIELIKKFRNFESDYEIQRRLMDRRQGPNESADAFITDIVKLKNQMRNHVSESELVKIVKDNLKDGLAQLIFPMRIENLDHLLEECKRAERNIAKRSSHRAPVGYTRRVYEVEALNSDEEDGQAQLVEALQKDKVPTKQFICWNCKAPGHSFIECPVVQRRLFCYKCGFEEVTSPTCPRCVGNQCPNTRKTGPACSTHNGSQ